MKTFNNKKRTKTALLKKLKHHQDLDTFIQGNWLTDEKVEGNGFKGCFYGCTMQTEDSPIEKFSEKYDIDLWYCYLTEKLFEGLPDGEYQTFPYQSIDLLPVGLDINKIKSKFHYALLMDEKFGQVNYCQGDKKCEDAIKQCAELFKVDFDKIDKSAAESAESAAWSARSARSVESARSAVESARSAVESARSARSAAESAARSAARSAAWSARSAARSAAWSAGSARSARSVAKNDYYVWMRDLLFNTIKETK